MNASGTLGFAPDVHGDISLDGFGAFITNPISLRPREAAVTPAIIEFPGGFLLHTGLPNPGLHAALDKYGRRWEAAALPVIPSLLADRPEETRQMVLALEKVENILAVELGFAPLLAPDIAALAVEMCRGELPLVISLPAEQILDLGPRLIELGAAAISFSPPRGALAPDGELVTGRLFGPALYPKSLEIVYSASRLGLPMIGAGGVRSNSDAEAMLGAGALAVQIDSILWLPERG